MPICGAPMLMLLNNYKYVIASTTIIIPSNIVYFDDATSRYILTMSENLVSSHGLLHYP